MSATDHVRCAIPADWASDFSQCLFEWQELEGGVLAVLAAVVGALLLWRQTRQSEKHHRNDIARRHNAARLTLPLALSEISKLTQRMADEVAGVLETFLPEGHQRTLGAILDGSADRKSFESVTTSPEAIAAFERFVESLDRNEDIKHVAELLASMQILLARYNGQDLQAVGVKMNLQSLLMDIAKVKLLNEKIFNYARFVDDESFGIVGRTTNEEAWDLIHGSAQALVFLRRSPDFFFPDFAERIDRLKMHAQSPWLEKFGA